MSGTIKITNLPNAGVLTGTERVPVVDGTVTKQVSTQQIADLAPSNFNAFLVRNETTGETDFLAPDGTTQFRSGNNPNAVNFLLAQGSIANGYVALAALGESANVPVSYAAKGVAKHSFGNGYGVLFEVVSPSSGVPMSRPAAQPGSSSIAYWSATSDVFTDISVHLLPLGDGGSAAGPNNTSTGPASFAAGRFCQATGYSAIALGNDCVANGIYSEASGNRASVNGISGKRARMTGLLGAARGTTQNVEFSMQAQGVGTTPQVLATTESTLSAINSLTLQNNSTMSVRVIVTGHDTTSGARATWYVQALFYRGASAGSIVLDGSSGSGSPTFSNGSGASTWTISVGVNTSFGSGTITCTGAGSNIIRWHANVIGSENAAG